METLILYIGIILFAIVGAGILFWGLNNIADDIINIRSLSKFSKEFDAAVKLTQPSSEEIMEIGHSRELTHNQIIRITKGKYRDILTGENKDLFEHKSLIESYLKHFKNNEPFDGLPSEIRIHLERLRDSTKPENTTLFEPLTTQIKDLISVKEKEFKLQKYISIIGVIIGLSGFSATIFPYLFDSESSTEVAQAIDTQ